MDIGQLVNDSLVGKLIKYNWKDDEYVVGEILRIKSVEDHYGYFEMTLGLLDGNTHTYMLVPTRKVTVLKTVTKKSKHEFLGNLNTKKLLDALSKDDCKSLTLDEKWIVMTYGMMFYTNLIGQDYLNNNLSFKSLFCRIQAEMYEKNFLKGLRKAIVIVNDRITLKSTPHLGMFGKKMKNIDVTNKYYPILNIEKITSDDGKVIKFYDLHNNLGEMIQVSILSLGVNEIREKE